jgi:hypothetical protein
MAMTLNSVEWSRYELLIYEFGTTYPENFIDKLHKICW